jgi:RNA polymerase sigma factor (TIGR02999 family)
MPILSGYGCSSRFLVKHREIWCNPSCECQTRKQPGVEVVKCSSGMSDWTRILERAQQGDPKAAEDLLPLVYTELRRLAAGKMAREKPGHTLQATALVHEAWLRLAGSDRQQWRGREHFISAAAEAMRRILVENARRKKRLRHGGGQERVDVESIDLPIAADDEKCLAIHEYLDELAKEDSQKAEVIKLRVFGGLKVSEIAAILHCSEKTVQRHWDFALAWLSRAFKAG